MATDDTSSRGDDTRKIPPGAGEDSHDMRPLMMVLGELDEHEREDLMRQAGGNQGLADDIRAVSEHLKVHQEVHKISPKRGSFARLAERMRREGQLDVAMPGVHAMWRRAFGMAVLALGVLIVALLVFQKDEEEPATPGVSTAMLRIFGDNPQTGATSKPVEIGKRYSVGERGGELWLATDQRDVSTSIVLARYSEFILLSGRELRLFSGMAQRVSVDERARYERGFVIETPNARVISRDGLYSVRIENEDSRVCVARGRVEAGPLLGEAPMRIISSGLCSTVTRGQAATDPIGMITLQIEPYGNDRQVLIKVVNRSSHRVGIKRADGTEPYYRLNVSQDTIPGSGIPGESGDFPALPIPGALPGTGTPSTSSGYAMLEPDGSLGNSQYMFVADLKAGLPGIQDTDLTLAVRYTGPVESPDFGILQQEWISSYLRLNLKSVTPGESGR